VVAPACRRAGDGEAALDAAQRARGCVFVVNEIQPAA
jgi:hypothetical protein